MLENNKFGDDNVDVVVTVVQRLHFYYVRMGVNNGDCDPVIEMKNINCVDFCFLFRWILLRLAFRCHKEDCLLLFGTSFRGVFVVHIAEMGNPIIDVNAEFFPFNSKRNKICPRQ